MKGYKATNKDMTCRGFKYEVGKTYTMDGKPSLCERGFHFCNTIADTFNYYDKFESRFFEVEATGDVVEGDDKNVTNQIVILREVSGKELSRSIYGYGDGNGDGYGYGYGYGTGYGNGYGYGYGTGDGYGNGYGYGYGYGYGTGDGYGNIQKIAMFKED